MEEFKCLSKFPNVVRAIDGSHFEIPAAEENPADYFNQKQFYSLVLQAIVDANQKFLHIAAGFPGSMHDSCIFRCTNIYDLLENGEILSESLMDLGDDISIRPLIIGDQAYPLYEWLM